MAKKSDSSQNKGILETENQKIKSILYTNTDQEIITITHDKIKGILTENKDILTQKNEWSAPLGVFLTIFITLLTTNFEDAFGLNQAVWQAIFIIVDIASFLFFCYSLFKHCKNKKKGTIESIIKQIEGETPK